MVCTSSIAVHALSVFLDKLIRLWNLRSWKGTFEFCFVLLAFPSLNSQTPRYKRSQIKLLLNLESFIALFSSNLFFSVYAVDPLLVACSPVCFDKCGVGKQHCDQGRLVPSPTHPHMHTVLILCS